MERYAGVFINYSYGAKQQYPKKGIIKAVNLESNESGKVIGWWVGWPENNPKLFGKIMGPHGKSGYLMAHFRHGLPGNALGQKVVITNIKPISKTHEHAKIPKPVTSKIIEIEGIGPKYAEKLHSIKIYTTSELLEAGSTPAMRKELAEKTDISPKLIHKWVNLSDLFRIKGVGEEYSDLLEVAGVDSVVELSTRNVDNLHAKLLEVNKTKKLVRSVPTLADVEAWIKEAKTLPRKVEY